MKLFNIYHSTAAALTMMVSVALTPAVMAEIVTGTVLDDSGEPAIGASVKLANNPKIATVTDIDGLYSIDVPDNADKLEFSYVGMETKIVSIDGRSKIDVIMVPKSTWLNEVVVIG